MSEKDNKENQEEKPMDTVQMLLGLATFAVSIYLLYVAFVGQNNIKQGYMDQLSWRMMEQSGG